MKKVLVIAAVTALAAAAWASPPKYVYAGKWGSFGTGNGQFKTPFKVAIASSGNVYVADHYNHRVQYFTSAGSYLGQWGERGTGSGQFDWPTGLAAAPNGFVYVADNRNNRVQYFKRGGSFLGKWGSRGPGEGEFYNPGSVAVNERGTRVYVVDVNNHRIQFFRWSDPAVTPASLGRVKALFE